MLINQPSQATLGDKIIEQLHSNKYNEFKFIVAYAKTSGVNRLLPYMSEFKTRGGIILGIVGIDQFNTSYEALISLCGICDELYIYHSEDSMKTFHVKAYSFDGNNMHWRAIGSNNFTAGGLFSNYEASTISSEDNTSVSTLFENYSNTLSPCCKKLTVNLIDLLLEKKYIQKEKNLLRQKLAELNNQHRRSSEDILFGRDHVSIPAAISRSRVPAIRDNIINTDRNYLIRFIPKAGNRSQQIHFTMDILKNFFCKNAGDHLRIQQIIDIFNPKPIEERQIVLSQRNRNVKLEVSAAEELNYNYPADNSKRPILLFKKVTPDFFEYILIKDGNPGYTVLNSHLNQLNWGKKSLPYEILDTGSLLSIWEDCPLI